MHKKYFCVNCHSRNIYKRCTEWTQNYLEHTVVYTPNEHEYPRSLISLDFTIKDQSLPSYRALWTVRGDMHKKLYRYCTRSSVLTKKLRKKASAPNVQHYLKTTRSNLHHICSTRTSEFQNFTQLKKFTLYDGSFPLYLRVLVSLYGRMVNLKISFKKMFKYLKFQISKM